MAPPGGVAFAVGASLAPEEVNAAYAWVEWPQRERWRLEAIARSCTWITARDEDGSLVGIARLLDDGGLHASLWDLIVRPDRQRQGIGRGWWSVRWRAARTARWWRSSPRRPQRLCSMRSASRPSRTAIGPCTCVRIGSDGHSHE